MKIGINLGYSGRTIEIPIAQIKEAEAMGCSSVWTAEAYGSDALTPLAWIGAHTRKMKLATGILQLSARAPAAAAMAAITLDQLSGGRMILGLGVSGPQVVEGWYGMPYSRPLGRMREYVRIIRAIFEREAPMSHDGEHYQIPFTGDGATGLGKPLKSILHGRPDIPIVIGAEGPKNIEQTAEIADGWLAMLLSPLHFDRVYRSKLDAGFAKAGGGKSIREFGIYVMQPIIPGADLDACRDQVRPYLALYIGGMGAKGQNFHKNAIDRYGYEEVTEKIQDLYLTGKKQEAAAAIPADLIDQLAFVGPKEHMRDQIASWKALDIDFTMLVGFDARLADQQLGLVRDLAEML
ncbi:MAG: LLM class F420-dependent oxidoreductase [Deltaproteobacteria bacterium]|nr:LLM class F420-dependent oxidoreductase [Deltaproteobacteria bacterium]